MSPIEMIPIVVVVVDEDEDEAIVRDLLELLVVEMGE